MTGCTFIHAVQFSHGNHFILLLKTFIVLRGKIALLKLKSTNVYRIKCWHRIKNISNLQFSYVQQAWYLTEATEAIASVAPGLCLGALSKVPTEIYKFLIEVPFAKEKSPCPFKYEVSGLVQYIVHVHVHVHVHVMYTIQHGKVILQKRAVSKCKSTPWVQNMEVDGELWTVLCKFTNTWSESSFWSPGLLTA